MDASRIDEDAPAGPDAWRGLDTARGPSEATGRALSQHADDASRERVDGDALWRRSRDALSRLPTWFQATPGELLGLTVLLLGAVAVTVVVIWDAGQRPDALPPAPPLGSAVGAVGHDGPPGADHTHTGPGGVGSGADTSASGTDTSAPQGFQPGEGPARINATVYISGAVTSPGVVVLEPDARVADAIAAAGGALGQAELERLNLARPVVDGEHVHVPRVGEEPRPEADDGPESGGSGVDADGRIDINRASQTELESLPGIGPAKAAAIMAFREEEGPFEVPGDLRAVPGIGEGTFQRLADLIAVR